MKIDEYETDLSPEPAPDSTAEPSAAVPGSNDQTTDTPDMVQDAATEAAALPLGDTSLLGTMLSDSDPRALVRLRDGQIRTLRLGDQLNRATVQAIEPGALVLWHGGTARRLGMPDG